ncbi:MAG: ribbon-helix-helix protein, CopG family [Anaerorhabdus sp.]
MSEKKKMGRPIIGEPMNIRLEIRISKELLNKIDVLSKKEKITRAEFIRSLIKKA